MGEVPRDQVVKLSSPFPPPPRRCIRRHQLPLRDVHKIGERLVHPLYMLGIGCRVPNPETIGVCIQRIRLPGVCAGVGTP